MIDNVRNSYIDQYLKNRNEDEIYSVPTHTAGYWLYHAPHDPLGEFEKMLINTYQEDNDYYKNIRRILINVLSD